MLRPGSIVLASLLTACGAEIVTAAPPAPTPTPVTPAPVTPAPVTPAPVTPAPLGACTTARPDGAVLTLLDGADVLVVDASGAARTLDAAGPGTPAAMVEAMEVSRDGYLAMSRQRRVSSSEAENTYALFAPDGTVRWRIQQTVRYGGSPLVTSRGLRRLFVSPGGTVVANHTSFDRRVHSWVEVISTDGTSRWRSEAAAVGPLDEAGRVPVEEYPNSATPVRWWSPATDSLSPLGAGGEAGRAVVSGPFTVAWELADAGVLLTSHRGARSDRFTLPFASLDGFSFDARDEGWLLATRRGDDGAMHRIDLANGRMEAITARYPERFGVGEDRRPGLTSDGALMTVMSDGEWAGLYRSEDGARWTLVGRHVTGTLGVETSERAGTYVVRAHNDLFVGMEWPERVRDEPGGLRGPSQHVVRPSTGRDVVLFAGDPERGFGAPEVAISPTGRCVAWVESVEGVPSVEVADLVDGTRHRTPLAPGARAGRVQWF